MIDAHVSSMVALGEPFREDAPRPFPFADQTITDRVRAQVPVMLRERLTPPPQETYSLNRKLSGAFMLCARLRANVDCREMFERITSKYTFAATGSTEEPPLPAVETSDAEQAAIDADGRLAPPPPRSESLRRGLHTAAGQRRDYHTSHALLWRRSLAPLPPKSRA